MMEAITVKVVVVAAKKRFPVVMAVEDHPLVKRALEDYPQITVNCKARCPVMAAYLLACLLYTVMLKGHYPVEVAFEY